MQPTPAARQLDPILLNSQDADPGGGQRHGHVTAPQGARGVESPERMGDGMVVMLCKGALIGGVSVVESHDDKVPVATEAGHLVGLGSPG
ncbi:hypothetical protein G7Z17_g12910 [Cylindrodendrum hubeiense]|uniref:Uncharacterized protein n=1 Tax=Cylindrodendrum hubeiense TaxID=595255 RepID=A0A9P5GZY9_9HYPO|nr:hypothetical protein G7Z17_g12910 [Cylindrodendrum hubeiense]